MCSFVQAPFLNSRCFQSGKDERKKVQFENGSLSFSPSPLPNMRVSASSGFSYMHCQRN